MMKNIQGKFRDNENKISKTSFHSLLHYKKFFGLSNFEVFKFKKKYLACLRADKENLEDEVKYFKSKVENMHKKNIQSDPNLHIYLRQQYEEELDYYKHQNFELQKVYLISRIKLEIARTQILCQPI
jgi:hypothetical protein